MLCIFIYFVNKANNLNKYLNIYVISECTAVFKSMSYIVGLYRMLIFFFSVWHSLSQFSAQKPFLPSLYCC